MRCVQDSDKNIFIHIMGCIPDELSNTNSQPTNGVLIQNLSKMLSCSTETRVFAFGEESDYKICRYMNNKCYYQLDSDHYYELDIYQAPQFTYFTSNPEAMKEINKTIKNSNAKNVMIFFDDNGSDGFFSSIHNLSIYQLIMRFPQCNFLVFNDSCFSGSFIDVVKTYDQIYDLKVNKKMEDILRIVYSMSALTSKIIKEAEKDKQTVDETMITGMVTNAIKSFSMVRISDVDILKAVIQTQIDDTTILSQPLGSIKLPDGLTDIMLNSLGLTTVRDVFYFKSIISSLISFENDSLGIFDVYTQCKKVFTLDNFNICQNILNSIIRLASTIEIFKEYGTVDYQLKPHPNIEVITSTDRNETLTYASIRVNELAKVYPSSIGMSSFIKEALLKMDGKPINFENIKNEISVKGVLSLEFPGRVDQSMRGDHKKREWIGLDPQHFKKGSYQFAFNLSGDFLVKVQLLRVISCDTAKKLRDAAEMIAPDFVFDPETVSNDQDPIGDVVAITAIMKKFPPPARNVDIFFLQSNSINSHCPLNIELLENIALISLHLSEDPIKMSALIYNYLQQAANQVVMDEHKGRDNTENMEMVNAVVAQMPFSAIVFSTIIAAPHTKEGTVEYVCNSVGKAARKKIRHEGSFLLNKAINELPKMNDDEEKIAYAEKCLMAYAKCALDYVENICNSQTINNISDRIYKGIAKYYTALSITIAIANRASEYEAQGTENILFNTIDRAYSSLSIQFQMPQQFKLDVLSGMSEGLAIKALAIFFYEEAEKKGKDIPLKEIFERIMHIVKTPSNDTYDNSHLSKLVEIIFEKIDDTKETIKNFRKDLLDEAIRAVEMTMERFRIWKRNCVLNTGNRISMTLYGKTNSSLSGLKSIRKMVKKSMPKSRIRSIITDLKTILNKIKPTHRDPFEMCDHGFGATQSPLDMDDIRMRAAHELYSVASRIAVYDPSIESTIVKEADAYDFEMRIALRTMIARACNIVEMVPIIEESSIKTLSAIMPTMPIMYDEVMALAVSGVKHFLRKKDKERMRSRVYKDGNPVIEDDDYYSSSYFEECEGPALRSHQPYFHSSSSSAASSAFSSPVSSPKMIKNRSSPRSGPTLIRKPSQSDLEKQSGKIKKLRGPIDIDGVLTRKSPWYIEAWPVFVYRFNVHVRCLGIKFDPDIKYEGDEVFIGKTFYEVLEFYPITQIKGITGLLSNFYRFVGKHKEHFEAICKAFYDAFDDTDRAVTPRHFHHSTMQRGDDDYYYVDESEL